MNKDKDQTQDNKKTPEELIKELDTTKLELQQMENNWKRALADYTNQQKRLNEERDSIRIRANEMLILNLLPVVDNMEMLIRHSTDQGFQMIFKELLKTLRESGLEEINTENKDFDITTMEAVDTEEGEDNKVIKQERKGYFLNGKLIRPAKVVVGKKFKEEN